MSESLSNEEKERIKESRPTMTLISRARWLFGRKRTKRREVQAFLRPRVEKQSGNRKSDVQQIPESGEEGRKHRRREGEQERQVKRL
jgi:hypothetical protein